MGSHLLLCAVLPLMLLLASGSVAQQPLVALQCGMDDYGTQPATWTSPATGIVYSKDEPYVVNIASTTRRCYGSSYIKFAAEGESDIYRCTRAGTVLEYDIPVANGNYRLTLLLSEDKWREFRNGNNGRDFHVSLEGNYVDTMSIFGRSGFNNAALDVDYCVTVSDGRLNIKLENVYTATNSYPAVLCGLRLYADAGQFGPCPIAGWMRRYDSNYWLPARGIWTQSINVAGAPYRSENGFMWSVDSYEYQPDGSGFAEQTGVPIPYDGMRSTDPEWLRNTLDSFVFTTRRVGDLRYTIPLSTGVYTVVTWHLAWSDYSYIGGRLFNISMEGVVVSPRTDVYLLCGLAYRACPLVFRNIAVTDGILDIQFTSIAQQAILSGIQVKPEDGLPLPAYVNYPGRFLADTGIDRPFNWPGLQGNILVAINCGGGEVREAGIVVSTDKWFDSASTTSTYGSAATTGTLTPGAYISQRRGSLISYVIPLQSAGNYTLRLGFCEYEYSTGSRVVRVTVQGIVVENSLDILGAAAQHVAVERDYAVTVTAAKTLTIQVAAVSGRQPLINYIEVRTSPARILPPPFPSSPPISPVEEYPVPFDGTVIPPPLTVAPGPFPAYVGGTFGGKQLVFAINVAPEPSQCCCDCSGMPCGCGDYVATTGITYINVQPFVVPPYVGGAIINETYPCYGRVNGIRVEPGYEYVNDLSLFVCYRSSFRAYFPNIAAGKYRLRTLHHDEKWNTLETHLSGNGGRGGTIDINDVRIGTVDYFAKRGSKATGLHMDWCITVDGRGHIEFSSQTLQSSSGPRIQAIELWEQDWTGACPYSNQDRHDLIQPVGQSCNTATSCMPCNFQATDFGPNSCLSYWQPAPPLLYAINCGGGPYISPESGISWSVDVKFGWGAAHRTGASICYDNNNSVVDGTNDDRLFECRRQTASRYWLPVPAAARYLLVVGTMEWDKGKVGWRPWNLYAEDIFIDRLDVYWRCGLAYRACWTAYYVWVTDGQLELIFEDLGQGVGVNALLLFQDDGTPASGVPSNIYIPPANKPYNWALQAGNVLAAVNTGGGEVVGGTGNLLWTTDYPWMTTRLNETWTSTYGTAIAGATAAPDVYISQRSTQTKMTFGVAMPAGMASITVDLIVYMAEYEYDQAGRTQSISVENGQASAAAFDVWTCAGSQWNKECVKTFQDVVVTDGVLNFEVVYVSARSAVINAFKVVAKSSLPPSAGSPSPSVIPTFGNPPSPSPSFGLSQTPTRTPVGSPSPVPVSASASRVVSASPSASVVPPSASPSATAPVTPSSTGTPPPTLSPSATPTRSPSSSGSPAVSPTPTRTAQPSPSSSATATGLPSASGTAPATPSSTGTPSPTSSASVTASATTTPSPVSATASLSVGASPSQAPSASAAATASASLTPSSLSTPSSTIAATGSASGTAPATVSASVTPSALSTSSGTPSRLSTPSETPSSLPSPSETASIASSPSATSAATGSPSSTLVSSGGGSMLATPSPTFLLSANPTANGRSPSATPGLQAQLCSDALLLKFATATAPSDSSLLLSLSLFSGEPSERFIIRSREAAPASCAAGAACDVVTFRVELWAEPAPPTCADLVDMVLTQTSATWTSSPAGVPPAVPPEVVRAGSGGGGGGGGGGSNTGAIIGGVVGGLVALALLALLALVLVVVVIVAVVLLVKRGSGGQSSRVNNSFRSSLAENVLMGSPGDF